MSYILPEAEREMDAASVEKDRRIAELEKALREIGSDQWGALKCARLATYALAGKPLPKQL